MLIRSRGSRPRRRRAASLRTLGVVSLLIGLLPAAVGAQQVVVEDLEVHLTLNDTRNTLTQVIPVKNEETYALQVRALLSDWYRDSTGRNLFVEPGALPRSCASRMEIFPTNLQVAPGATELIRVSYTPAPNDSGCWTAVLIETVQPPRTPNATEGSFLTVEVRTGVKVYVHAKDPVSAGEIQSADIDLFWRRADPRSRGRDTVQVREAVLVFANTGTAHLRVRTSIEIRDVDARMIRREDGPEYPMTPGAEVQMHFPLLGLAVGNYIAVILLDYGGAEISAAQVDFRVP